MIILHFHLQLQFKYELFHIYFTSFHFTPHGKIWTQLIDLAPNVWLHIAQLVEHCTSIAWRSQVRIPLKPWFFQASSFQLLKLENLLWWSFFTFIYNCSSNMNYFIYTSQNHYSWTQIKTLKSNNLRNALIVCHLDYFRFFCISCLLCCS